MPAGFEALQSQMQGFPGFALMFAMVGWIWYEHGWFFRHTRLQDDWTAQAMDMRFAAGAHAVGTLLGLTSLLIAAIGYLGQWAPVAGIAGSIYFLMGPLHGWNGRQLARARERVVGA